MCMGVLGIIEEVVEFSPMLLFHVIDPLRIVLGTTFYELQYLLKILFQCLCCVKNSFFVAVTFIQQRFQSR